MFNTKGSHLSELIHELTNMDIDSSNISRHGDFVNDEDMNEKAIRLSRYVSSSTDLASYSRYARNLVQQSVTELTFMSERECEQVFKRFDLLSERFTKAWDLYFKHHELFYEGKFSSLEFEWAFFHLFNIPIRRSGAMDVSDFGELKTTGDFWSDLHDALMYKQGMLLELSHDLREIYNIPQPENEAKRESLQNANSEIVRELSDQDRAIIFEILAPLSGYNPIGLLIMSAGDFKRLLHYAEYLILHDSLPETIQAIQQIGISDEHVRYTFYRLHKRLFTTKSIRPSFINFLHQVFRQFEGYNKETTRKKFSVEPKSYLTDFNISS